MWDSVGLDIEPDARIYLQIMNGPWGLLPMLAPRLLDRARPARSKAAYQELVEQIHADGWQAENYQFPLIADERQAGSALLQRLALVDAATDREVWMLYSSFLRPLGPGLIWAYGPQAQAIAVGTTGGGPDIPGSPQMPSLTWEQLAGDLRLARHFCDQILIHSLEGCVWQGILPRLRSFEWADADGPPDGARAAATLRRAPARSLVGQRASLARAGITAAAAWLHLALAPQMTFCREMNVAQGGMLEAPRPAVPGSCQPAHRPRQRFGGQRGFTASAPASPPLIRRLGTPGAGAPPAPHRHPAQTGARLPAAHPLAWPPSSGQATTIWVPHDPGAGPPPGPIMQARRT